MSAHPVRFAVSLQNDRPIAETVEQARLAESLGYPEIWTNENGHYRGIFTVASTIAANTRAARIGLGIVNPFHRHPSVIAMEAATLDEASGGRLRLGIGAALWTLRALGENEAPPRAPPAAMTEALQIIRAMVSDGGAPDPKIFTARASTQLDFVPHRPHLPIYVGA